MRLVGRMAIYRLEAKIISRGSGTLRRCRCRLPHRHENSRRAGGQNPRLFQPHQRGRRVGHSEAGKFARMDGQNCLSFGTRSSRARSARMLNLHASLFWRFRRNFPPKNNFNWRWIGRKRNWSSKGMVAEVSLHHTKSGKNPHVHILCTMRTLDGDKFSAKKPREWNDKELLVQLARVMGGGGQCRFGKSRSPGTGGSPVAQRPGH